MTRSPFALALLLAAATLPPLLTGCAPVVVAGAAGAALVATDRRSAGTQLDDQTIETKIATTVAGKRSITKPTNIRASTTRPMIA